MVMGRVANDAGDRSGIEIGFRVDSADLEPTRFRLLSPPSSATLNRHGFGERVGQAGADGGSLHHAGLIRGHRAWEETMRRPGAAVLLLLGVLGCATVEPIRDEAPVRLPKGQAVVVFDHSGRGVPVSEMTDGPTSPGGNESGTLTSGTRATVVRDDEEWGGWSMVRIHIDDGPYADRLASVLRLDLRPVK
jgi:hypothetical protein